MATSFEPALALVLANQRNALQGVLDMAHEALTGVERMSALTLQLTRDSLTTSGGQARALLADATRDDAAGEPSAALAEPDRDWGASYFAQACAIATELTGSLTDRLHRQVWDAHHALADSLLAMASTVPGMRDEALEAARAMLQATPRTIADAIDAACRQAEPAGDALPGTAAAPPPLALAPTPTPTTVRRRGAAAARNRTAPT